MELLIVTGMSGAGKSVVANALEDIGFYCIDNMPPSLIKPVAELSMRGNSDLGKMAIVTDIRGGKMFGDLIPALKQLQDSSCPYKLLFLDSTDERLVTRYKETRRRHPLSKGPKDSLAEAIAKERRILKPLKEMADYIIDTTNYSTSNTKQRINSLFLNDINDGMTVQCMSFGFKYGPVPEADIVYDVRCLKNPFYVAELKALTGLQKEVRDFVLEPEEAKELKNRIFSLIDYSLPLYCKEGKSQLVVAIGCTGGKHRSVVFAEQIYEHIKQNGYKAAINHRDISKE